MGRDYFFKKYFVHHLTFKVFKFFKENKFFVPFGFVGYLRRIWRLLYSKKYRKKNQFFKRKSKKLVFKSLREKLLFKRMQLLARLKKYALICNRAVKGFLRRVPLFKKERLFSRKSRVPSFMSKLFYKRIFFFRYRLFLFFKKDLKARFKILSKYLFLFFGPFIRFFKFLLAKKKFEIVNKSKKVYVPTIFHFSKDEFWYSAYHNFIFKFFDKVELKSLNLESIFFKRSIFFFKNFFKRTFFISLLFKFFKQLSFLRVPGSFY